MRMICMICKEQYGEKPGEGESHGVCPECLPEYKADIKRQIAEMRN